LRIFLCCWFLLVDQCMLTHASCSNARDI
jgi:hypothetical protein